MEAKIVHRKSILGKILALAIALCFLTAAPLAAQDYGQEGDQQQKQKQQQQEYQTQESQKGADDFSDEELEKFSEARSKVEEMSSEYSQKLEGVEDPEKAREIQTKYSQKMSDAIEDIGLSVQTYNEISRAAQNNPELREKIFTKE